MTAPSSAERIREALRELDRGGRSIALGWATVEIDRVIALLTKDLRLPADAFRSRADSIALGARCLVASGVLADARSLAILEPIAEGRLAAILARHDEGPAVGWVIPWGAAEGWSPGPFGPERLVPGDRTARLIRLMVEPAPGTIPT